ncbi:MAG: hypothetical protein DLM73_09630 [Chthoniobacterales bacterium]|nr:MAG: hypothetical protein DLM73_09630 [Chthoniobacterales bacterium]
MAGYYTVQEGDYVSSIAKKFGFSDYRTVWNHPNNTELKAKRENPNVLFPGDRLFIPERTLGLESRATDSRHTFVARLPNLKLRLVLEDCYEKPIAGAPCILQLGSETRHLKTDNIGRIDETLSPDIHEAILIIQDDQTAFSNLEIPVKIGNLHPVDQLSGQYARLNNLGYFAGEPGDSDDNVFRSAVEEFQCDHGLKVDGVCGRASQAKLKQVNGC